MPQYFSPEEETGLIDFLDGHIDKYFVLEENGIIVGCGGYDIIENGTTARIAWDFFIPHSQGKGHGSELVHFRLEQIKKFARVEKVIVRTSQYASGFYTKHGFKLISIEKDYWASGYDLHLMEMQLTGLGTSV